MELQAEFEHIVNTRIKRNGVNDLLTWLKATDFFITPASTKYHGACECGLLMHSIEVYHQLEQLAEFYGIGIEDGIKDPDESIAICGLFHDICKIGCYKTEMRWRKNKNDKWEQYSTYKFEEDFAYGGHGSKSVFLLQSFINLLPEEASAINCHMGQWEATQYGNPSTVYERNKLAWLLHVADEASTYLYHK